MQTATIEAASMRAATTRDALGATLGAAIAVGAIAVGAAVFGSTPAVAQTQQTLDGARAMAQAQINRTLSTSDATFLTQAARGGLAEVKLGQLAQQQGGSDAVKQFGQRMVTDHSRAADELKVLAKNKQFSLPTEPGSDDQQLYDQLAKLHGQEFDAAYARAMVKDHQEDILDFQKEGGPNGTDPDVRAWAVTTLPTLKQHLDMASRLPSG